MSRRSQRAIKRQRIAEAAAQAQTSGPMAPAPPAGPISHVPPSGPPVPPRGSGGIPTAHLPPSGPSGIPHVTEANLEAGAIRKGWLKRPGTLGLDTDKLQALADRNYSVAMTATDPRALAALTKNVGMMVDQAAAQQLHEAAKKAATEGKDAADGSRVTLDEIDLAKLSPDELRKLLEVREFLIGLKSKFAKPVGGNGVNGGAAGMAH